MRAAIAGLLEHVSDRIPESLPDVAGSVMKKLKLQRQTVRVLAARELRIADGGIEAISKETCSCMHICDPWPPPPPLR